MSHPTYPRPYRVKFCGVTRELDVQRCIELNVDAIGLNFVEDSSRRISLEKAVELHQVGQKWVRWVGVFVNPTQELIARTLERIPLDFIQLHGEEQAEDYSDHVGPPIIKALPWRGDEDAPQVQSWKSKLSNDRFRGFLVDAYDPVQRGGTGKRVDWSLLQPRPQCFQEVSLILAGGLNPETVAEAISVVRPDGLDVASGVEESPGVKSQEKMKRFMEIVQSVGFP